MGRQEPLQLLAFRRKSHGNRRSECAHLRSLSVQLGQRNSTSFATLLVMLYSVKLPNVLMQETLTQKKEPLRKP